MIGFGAGWPGWAFWGAGVASSTPAVGSTALTPAAVPAPPPPPHPLSATSISRAGPTGLLGTRPSFSTDRLDEGLHDELRLEHGSGGVTQGASGGGLRGDQRHVGRHDEPAESGDVRQELADLVVVADDRDRVAIGVERRGAALHRLRRNRGQVGAADLGAGGNGVDEPRHLVLVGDQLAERLEGAPVGLGLLLEALRQLV